MTNKPHDPTVRAGIVPVIKINDVWHYQFMIPSDPEYGGSHPQIAKGRVEADELDLQVTAVREGFEELGLLEHNIKNISGPFVGTMTGKSAVYTINAFVAEIYDQDDYGQPHYETGSTLWLTAEQGRAKVRRSQMELFLKIVDYVENR